MSRTAVVLINLGGPATQKDVEPFLARLFSDVIRLPWGNWGSKTIGKMIARRRAAYSRGMYQQIGGGSPILAETEAQAEALQRELGDSYHVSCAMRYSSPTIRQAQARLAQNFEDWDRVIALPLFPQYSFATTRTCLREWQAAGGNGDQRSVFIGAYHDHPDYIAALQELLAASLEGQENSEDIHVVFSAHGVPTSYIRKGDVYQTQIEETTQKVMAGQPNPFSIAYQSRVGPVKWLKPNTLELLPALADAGIKRVAVVPISFVCEHLETLYELDILVRDVAVKAGISTYLRVPTPGVHRHYIAALADIAQHADRYRLQ